VAGRAGVPGDAGVVALNVTVDAARESGFVTVHACGTALPTASNLNYIAGQTVANAVVARVGSGGAVCFYTDGATDLIVDVTGVFPATTLNALDAPQRLLDTRPGQFTADGSFAGGGIPPAGSTLQLLVAGRAGVPASAAAVILNVTADAAEDDGFVTVHPTGTGRPNASNLNYKQGQTIANAAIARVGAGGQICLYTFGSTHLIVDVAGWLTGPAPAATDSGCEAASSPPPPTAPPTAPTTTPPVIPPNPGDVRSFTTEAGVAPSSLARNAVATTTAWVTSGAAETVLVSLEVYNPAGVLVYEQAHDNQSFTAGQRRSYSFDWTIPPTEPLGTHTVRIGVFTPGWSTLLHWNDSAAAFTVTAPPPPVGFREEVAFTGLTNPTQLSFAPDGRIFVAEKSGLIKVFDNLTDSTPTVFADLRTNVHNFWDRGLLGMALHPQFPTQPYVYVLYTHDAAIGGTAPRWGTVGGTSDGCPTPPGATGDGCVVSGRLSRLQANGNVMTGPEQVLIEDWCQQYPSHSMGSLGFGADGALYVTGGDGASFNFVDYGQAGNPVNPCGDPPGGVGATLTPPAAEGGALRSQDLRTSGDPASLNGAVLRVDPVTGAGMPGNPLAGSADANARRIIAHGLRNPFRFAIRPGTNEVWVGDVGWDIFEEINRVVAPAAPVENFGWPCVEGSVRQPGYDVLDLSICENLYAQSGSVTPPFFAYAHTSQVVSGETCPIGSSSIAGLAFYSGGPYPASYDGALFFADYSRDCIWVIFPGVGGLPNPSSVTNFVTPATNPVDVRVSPEGELFYVDFDGGTIRRIRYFDGNQPPTAVASASATYGPVPLTVNFNATASSDPDAGDTLSYAWDLDGDGAYDDSVSASPSWTYQSGPVTVGLLVTDSRGGSNTDSVVISAGNTPPLSTIGSPTALVKWKVGDVISFSGSAIDQEDGALAPSRLSWSLVMRHCPSNCHSHLLQTFTGVSSGSFTTPDHEYPSHLELRLTATDSGGLIDTKSVLLQPQTVDLTFQSAPVGLQLVVGPTGQAAPFTRTVIVGSSNSVSATSPQTLGGDTYTFSAWSDGGQRTHSVTAPATSATYTATFASTGATSNEPRRADR
jgi:glucose/arabinose dehydrogenase